MEPGRVSNAAISLIMGDNSLLHYALSFLEFREAAASATVAKSWNAFAPERVIVKDEYEWEQKFTDARIKVCADLGKWRRLKHLAISNCRAMTEVALEYFGTNICTLSIRAFALKDDHFQHISRMSKLESLTLKGINVPKNALQPLRGMQIHTLALDYISISDTDLEPLEGMPLLSFRLISLHMYMKGSGFRHLANAPIETLICRYDSYIHSFEGLPYLQKMPLKHFVLCNQGINDDNLNFLRGRPLRHLDLSLNKITSIGLKNLIGMHLMHLNLKNTLSCDEAIPYLIDMPLSHLNLSSTKVTAVGLNILGDAHLRGMRLRFLGLNRLKLTDKCMAPLKKMKTLVKIT